ncbi:uncharacterized protein LOC133286328 [Gastrolobium bilobum]|uniref:uncharacterized protein LOC133286328 n=1 Tax=Gastrolobium bilobum TaxID=150636 RepID=UPI002AB23E71|nr:uncharacterized protein LOC133286328 [Gastrolobium bilobum]
MSVIFWNCRGATKPNLGRTLKSIVVKHKVCMVGLMETRTDRSKCKKLLKKINFDKMIIEEANGFSGGIWVFWDSVRAEVQAIQQTNQYIHMKVTLVDSLSFLCTAVYGSPHEGNRHLMWEDLIQLSSLIHEPWIMAGDFNDIKASSEKNGGSSPDIAKCQRFLSFLDRCQVEDVDCVGSKYTWQGPKWNHLERVFKKLDRVCANVSWRITFEEAEVRTLPRILSDHNPLLITMKKQQQDWSNRPFHFLATWMNHPGFEGLIEERWNSRVAICDMLANLIPHLQKWNKDVFGDIIKKRICYHSKLREVVDRRWLSSESMWPRLTQADLQALIIPPNDYEIWQNMFDMGAFKALGNDGYPAIFFQRQWGKVKTQVSFVPNRQIQDNITIAQELIHAMNKMKGRKAYMAIKIDLVKAYDRVSWSFMCRTLEEIWFPEGLINIIMQCLSSSRINVLWNGGKTAEFETSRGLRQDDLLMFMEAKEDQILTLLKCLSLFEEMSGQKLSVDKTCIFFSKNTPAETVDKIVQISGFKRVRNMGRYLGAIMQHGRVSKNLYASLVDKVQERMSNWQKQCLFQAGRISLSQYVLSAIPYFHMQSCKLPKAKGETGLGIKRLDLMNDAFLAKKIWRMYSQPHLLWVQVLLAKYKRGSRNQAMFEARNGDSSLWKNMCRLWHIMEGNLLWELGNGKEIRFWCDKWLPMDRTLRELVIDEGSVRNDNLRVAEAVTQAGDWDMEWIRSMLPSNVSNMIYSFLAPHDEDRPDRLIWSFNNSHLITVKEIYNRLYGHAIVDAEAREMWKCLWSWNGPQKVKIFGWKLLHHRLLTKSRIASWNEGDSRCPYCGANDETILHALRDCNCANRIWDQFLPSQLPEDFFNQDLYHWLYCNVVTIPSGVQEK